MPSLRRSFSSPSVRSSPYSPSLSTTTRPRQSAPHPRRSSGSATAERRVLADIEWWRVHDGQCDLDLQDDAHTMDGDGVPPSGSVMLSAGGDTLVPPQTILPPHSFSMDSMQSVLPDPFAIAPYSPHGSNRRGGDSSVESTPELSTAPLETVLANSFTCPLGYHLFFPPSPTRMGGRQAHPLFGLRSVSAPGLSHHGTFEPDFADIGGDTFSLDQNLFQ